MEGIDKQLLEGFNTPLYTAESGEDLSVGLMFDSANYAPIEYFAEAINKLRTKKGKFKPKKYIPINALRVNGNVKYNEPMTEYLANEAISSSLVKQAIISPRHYLIAKTIKIEPRNTKHFEIGTFAHSAILEPSKFEKVAIEPQANRSTTAGCKALIEFYTSYAGEELEDMDSLKIDALRAKCDALRAKCEELGYTFIGAGDSQLVNIMRQTCKTYAGGIVVELMKYAKKELSMYGCDPQTGLDVKIRPDAILLEEDFGINAIVSVKTTAALNPDAFFRDCAKFKYEVTEGMYLDAASHITGRNFSGTLMIVMQTAAPYQMFAFWWDAEDLQVGKYKYYDAMETIKKSEELQQYPGFESLAEEGHHGIIKGKLPNYIKFELPPKYVEGEIG